MGSMLRRCANWDYRQRGIYMVTLTVEGRRPLFGSLVGGETVASVTPTAAGEGVAACWREIPARFPGVTLMEYQVMPDHFHGIVFVRESQKKPLGAIMGAFKSHSTSLFLHAACGESHAARGMAQNGEPPSPSPAACGGGSVLCPAACGGGAVLCPAACGGGSGGHRPPELWPRPPELWPRPPALWTPGFQDTILFHKGQLANMRAYVLDNPRRLAVKRAHPELFRIVRDLPCCGERFAAIGNHFLLEYPVKRQVQCSRSIAPEALAEKEAELLAAARHGAVLVSPCISPGEKRIARAALAAGRPLIVLLENGFPPFYKPPKTYFEACAAGRLLMLAPWPHHTDKRPITREQCLALNGYAKRISEGA